jgi:lysophospholipase L1-like esterase
VAAVALARPALGRAGTDAIEAGTSIAVPFGGAGAVTIPPGGSVTSDGVGFAVTPGTNVTVTVRLGAGPSGITTHPGSRTTSHVVPANAVDRAPVEQVAVSGLPDAVRVEHWYFLTSLQVHTPPGDPGSGAAAAVFLGDSLTDGRGSTTDGNDRWPDLLRDRLHEAGRPHVAIVNQAAGGNRVLRDGLGVAALARLDRDVLGCAGVAWLVLFEGVNDIGTAEASPAAQHGVGGDLIAGYAQIVERAQDRGIRVYGATLTPFGGHDYYDDTAGLREQTRRRVNGWIRASGRFDAVLDFDRAVRDPGDHRRVRPALHVGDGLHLNPAGYRTLALTVPTDLFPAQ